MNDVPFDVDKADRWFAVECNNRTWDLIEKTDRSVEEVHQMIDLAHAAAWHWSNVGSLLNQLRAQCLLATAYVAAGWSDMV